MHVTDEVDEELERLETQRRRGGRILQCGNVGVDLVDDAVAPLAELGLLRAGARGAICNLGSGISTGIASVAVYSDACHPDDGLYRGPDRGSF